MAAIYDGWIVLLSIVISITASYVSLDLVSKAYARSQNGAFPYWIVGSALTMGTGIWSMHFIGLLAFSLPIPLSYEIPATFGSYFIAVLAAGLALFILKSSASGWPGIVFAGLLLGMGIAAMHYVGMSAIPVRPSIEFDAVYASLSAAIAVLASTAALWLIVRLGTEPGAWGLWKKLSSASIMGAAIAGVHYVAMAAAKFAGNTVCTASARPLDNSMLAAAVAALTLVYLFAAIVVGKFMSRTPTIRSSLLLLVTACFLPAAILVITAIFFQYERERERLLRDSITTVRAITLAVDRDLAGVESSLLALSTSPYAQKNELEQLYTQAKSTLQHMNATNIYLADANGMQLFNTLKPFGSALPRSGIASLIQEVIATGQSGVSDMFIGAVSGRHVLAVIVPMVHNGKAESALGATISPERLSDLLTRQRLPANWIVTIYDKKKTIVARTHEIKRFLGEKASTDLLREMMLRPEGTLEGRTREGIHVVAAFTQSASSGWSVSIGIPKSELARDLYRSIWIAVGVSIILLGLGLLMAALLSYRIGNSIRALLAPAHALSMAEPVLAPQTNLEEVDDVGRALQKTSEILFQTQYQAQHDVLTGLANRTLMIEFAKKQLMLNQRNKSTLAILYIDLDGFKSVNDTYGHGAGDEVLQCAARRIIDAIRGADLAVRLGGDEFAVLLVNPGRSGAASVARKLIKCLSLPMATETGIARVSASIGIALYPDSGASIEELMRRADEAMYLSKKSGKNRYGFAEPMAVA